MSAFPRKPEHFLEWLRKRVPGAAADTFASRKLYGEYLHSVLQDTIAFTASPRNVFTHIRAEAIGAEADSTGARLLLTDGSTVRAERVVLALGNPASCPAPGLSTIGLDERWHASPWLGDALRVRFAGERILIVGTGLTAVDAVVALQSQDLPCSVKMVSRRGILPQVHNLRVRSKVLPQLTHRGNLRRLVRELREHIEAAPQADLCWRSIVDALRPISNRMWAELSEADHCRFMRHLKRYWEPHRHRMAPEIRRRLDGYLASGAVEVMEGRVGKARDGENGLDVPIRRRDGSVRVLAVDRIISCTGVLENYADSPRPLVRSLIQNGLATVHEQGVGFRTDSTGALIDARMRPSAVFFTLGPPCRGQMFETTAVPEIRTQAETLALHLATYDAVPEFQDYCI